MMYYYGGHFWWGWLFWLILIVVIVYIVVRLISSRSNTYSSGPTPPQETALDIVKKRYAKGEITKEQFEQMKRDIGA